MLSTTLAELKAAKACQPRYKHLYKSLGGVKNYGRNTPITYLQILEICGLDDCLWALFNGGPATRKLGRIWALDCAERVQHLVPEAQQLNAVTRRFLAGEATLKELATARATAWDASAAARATAWDASAAARATARAAACAAARDAAWDAAWDASTAAWDAAWAAARDAASVAAWATAWDAASATARATASVAAWATAWDSEREWQIQHLKDLLQAQE